jgi:hypothetical protein
MTQASEGHGDFGAAVAQPFEPKMEAVPGSPAQAKPESSDIVGNGTWIKRCGRDIEPAPIPNRERSDLPHDWWPRQACWDRARALDLTEGLGACPRKHLAEVGGLFERSDFRSGFLGNPVLHLLLASIPRSQHGLVSDWRGS